MKRRARLNPWAKGAEPPHEGEQSTDLSRAEWEMISASPAEYRYVRARSEDGWYRQAFLIAVLPRGTKLSRITVPMHQPGWGVVWVDLGGRLVGVFDEYEDHFMGRPLWERGGGGWHQLLGRQINRWIIRDQGPKVDPRVAMRILLGRDPPARRGKKVLSREVHFAHAEAVETLNKATDDPTYLTLKRLAVDYVTETGELARLAGVR